MPALIWKYLSITKDSYGIVNLDKQCLQTIRDKFDEIYEDRDRDDDDLKDEYIVKLIGELGLVNDQTSSDYLNICVSGSIEYAEQGIKNRIRADREIIKLIPTDQVQPDPIIHPQISPNPTEPRKQVAEQEVTPLDKIICIVHQKSTKIEVDDFLRDFLFRQVNQKSNTSPDANIIQPICDGTIHSLSQGSLLDLFIRQLMIDRGTVTFLNSQTKYRLVEPISLTDEFESWTFDHFHGLLDFWLAIDSNIETNFPSPWTLNPDAHIDYIIVTQLTNADNDSSGKHSERPSTKSLENFIRDICRIQANGMFNTWYKALCTEENIATYAHLTNLNQKEWDRIGRLPMNALKTIKFYVDQEKQMVEERKTKKLSEDKTIENKPYSKAEIRANLHMIKLYFNRQLEDTDGIEIVPRLEAYCVDTAFQEMREEGYEDDGLFDEMKLFFQPLTVTEKELIINKNTLSTLYQEQVAEGMALKAEIEKLKQRFTEKDKKIKKLSNEIEQIIIKRDAAFIKYQSDLDKEENESLSKQLELNNIWE
ncbi:unnamed protein product, partial [Adineta steineri]